MIKIIKSKEDKNFGFVLIFQKFINFVLNESKKY